MSEVFRKPYEMPADFDILVRRKEVDPIGEKGEKSETLAGFSTFLFIFNSGNVLRKHIDG